jgi:DNA (cytosine-5)-methyltransferase 1
MHHARTTELDVMRARLDGTLDATLGDYRPRIIDLFCGAGGMTVGFTQFEGHRFEPVWANDFNADAWATYSHNFGVHGVAGDIVAILEDPDIKVPEADVVVGGPPCQGFSLLNRNRDGDPRRHLWRPFLDVVERSGARVFVMENVPQLIGSYEEQDIRAEAERQGFKTAHAVLCAADYGVPQARFRTFIVGARDSDPAECFPPKRTHRMPSDKGLRRQFVSAVGYVDDPLPWATVRSAIGDLPQPVGTEIRTLEAPLDLHFGRQPSEKSVSRYRSVPPGGNRFDLQANAPEITPQCWLQKPSGGTDLFGRLWWDRAAVTIRTEFYKPEKGRYLHPEEHRPITHREAARLQSFPDGFRFVGSKTEIARQIGNAVPPKLAARIADSVVALLLAGQSRAG